MNELICHKKCRTSYHLHCFGFAKYFFTIIHMQALPQVSNAVQGLSPLTPMILLKSNIYILLSSLAIFQSSSSLTFPSQGNSQAGTVFNRQSAAVLTQMCIGLLKWVFKFKFLKRWDAGGKRMLTFKKNGALYEYRQMQVMVQGK
jgi:hypothetical protein